MQAPTEKTLLEAKARYGSISRIVVEGQPFYYRSLTPSEMSALVSLEASMPSWDWVMATTKIAVIFPKEFEFEKAGSPYALHDVIMNSSIPEMTDNALVLSEYRDKAAKLVNENHGFALARLLVQTMPGYRMSDLIQMTIDQLLMELALAEQVLGTPIIGVSDSNSKIDSNMDPANALKQQIQQDRRQLNGRV